MIKEAGVYPWKGWSGLSLKHIIVWTYGCVLVCPRSVVIDVPSEASGMGDCRYDLCGGEWISSSAMTDCLPRGTFEMPPLTFSCRETQGILRMWRAAVCAITHDQKGNGLITEMQHSPFSEYKHLDVNNHSREFPMWCNPNPFMPVHVGIYPWDTHTLIDE